MSAVGDPDPNHPPLLQEQGKLLVMEAKLADQSQIQDLQHKKVVSHVHLLSRTICYLRAQYTGAVPLQRQQRLGEAVRALITEKRELTAKLTQVNVPLLSYHEFNINNISLILTT